MPTPLLPLPLPGGLFVGDDNTPTGQNRPFWVQVTGTSGSYFTFAAVQPTPIRGFTTISGGKQELLYPANGGPLAVGDFVMVQRAYIDVAQNGAWIYVTVNGENLTNTTFNNPTSWVNNSTFNWTVNGNFTWTLNANYTFTGAGPLIFNVSTVNIGNSAFWTFDSTTTVLFLGIFKFCGVWIINANVDITLVADQPALPLPAKPRQGIIFAGFVLRGMVAPVLAARDLQRVIIVNNGASSGTITNQDGAASAANRFLIPGGQTLQMQTGDIATWDYDPAQSRWVLADTTSAILRTLQTTTVAANTNNFALNIGADSLQVNCTGAANLTGMAGGITDRRVLITNTGSANLSITNLDAGSTGSNQFLTSTGATIVLVPLKSLYFQYDGTNWRDVGASAGVGAGVVMDTTLFDHFADAGNVGAGETDLYADTIAAGQLATNGDKLDVWYGLSNANNLAAKTLRVYFNAILIYTFNCTPATLDTRVRINGIRVNGTTVRWIFDSAEGAGGSTTNGVVFTEQAGLTLANANVFKITGQATNNNDIVAKCGSIKFVRHA